MTDTSTAQWYAWSSDIDSIVEMTGHDPDQEGLEMTTSDVLARLNALEGENARLKAALEKIASGWKYPPGPGMRPPPQSLGQDGMKRLAREALEQPLQ